MMAKQYGIRITTPKFGISRSDYSFDIERRTIAKGMASMKYMGAKVAEELYEVSKKHDYKYFSDLLNEIAASTTIDARQLSTLIHIDFFSDFGNQRELENIVRFWEFFKRGEAKQVRKEKIDGSYIEAIVRRHSTDRRKDGTEATSYTLTDVPAIIRECEGHVLSVGLEDYSIITKAKYFNEAMGYNGFVSGREEDRSTLFVREVSPVKRKKDGKQFGYGVLTQSLGSGIESRFTVFNDVYNQDPIKDGDVIKCLRYRRDGKGYFTLESYRHIDGDTS